MKLCIVFIKCESCHKRIIVEIDKGKINKYKRVFRNMQVYYIYGSAGCGKTSYVFNKHGYDDVYRTTNYEFGWVDDYNGEKVLFLDEFRSSFKISEILDYLDGQPIRIRGRHYNRVACYDTVYIVSNLEDLYVEINSLNFMELSPRIFFRRRIQPRSTKNAEPYSIKKQF